MASSRQTASRRGSWASLSVGNKLVVLIVSVTLVAVLAFSIVTIWLGVNHVREQFETRVGGQASLLASSLEAAISFLDEEEARNTLQSLRVSDYVIRAAVFLPDKKLFASYERETLPESSLSTEDSAQYHRQELQGRTLSVTRQIALGDDVIGTLRIDADLREIDDYLEHSFVVFVLCMIGALLISLQLSRMLQGLITGPMHKLKEAANEIRRSQDFSLQVERENDDEIGELVSAFNEMVHQIDVQNNELRQNEERFRSYFELGVVGMAMLDQGMHWKIHNDRLNELLGYGEDELAEKTLLELIPADNRGAVAGEISLLGETSERSCVIETRMSSRSRGELYVILSVRRMDEPATGRRQGTPYLVLLHDITDRKHYERQLEDAKEKAESADRIKSEFLAVMSHEIRTPMNAIMGYSELLTMADSGHERDSFVSEIRKSSQHLVDLLTEILDYSKMSSEKTELSLRPVNVSFELNSLCQMFQSEAKEKGLELRSSVDASMPPSILLDLARFRQILMNLIENGIKYTPEGHVEVALAGVRESGNQVTFEIRVSDSGIGIDESQLAHIFQPFTQVDSSSTRRYGGVGLGLAISSRLVELMGGTLACDSRVGQGSCFHFTLTGKRSPVNPATEEEETLVGNVDETSVKLLCVEDDPQNAEMIMQLLQRLGYDITLVHNGKELLEELALRHYDIVMMDLQMPVLNGIDATRQIRRGAAGERIKEIYIIGVTAYAMPGDRERCFHVGMNDFVSKPVTRKSLTEAIDRAIHHVLPS